MLTQQRIQNIGFIKGESFYFFMNDDQEYFSKQIDYLKFNNFFEKDKVALAIAASSILLSKKIDEIGNKIDDLNKILLEKDN